MEIPELSLEEKPCFYKGAGLLNGAFIRVGDSDRKLSPYEVQALFESRKQPQHDAEPLAGTSEQDLDDDLIEPLLHRLRSREGAPYRDWSRERILR